MDLTMNISMILLYVLIFSTFTIPSFSQKNQGEILEMLYSAIRANDLPSQERPIIVAHRGASGYAPENTLAAFKLAVRMKADCVELDVQMSKDGHVVVIHDETLERTTNGNGKVGSRTLAELKRLDAGAWFDKAFNGARIPTLHEVILLLKGLIKINIEIKVKEYDPKLTKMVVDMVRQEAVQDETIITSFDQTTVEKVCFIAADIKCGLISNQWTDSVMDGPWPYAVLKHTLLDRKRVEQVHQSGKKIFGYTVNSADRMKELAELGVDGIISDYPELLSNVLTEN